MKAHEMRHDQRLAGKVAVVTGASRGIGKAIALGFAHEGACVCCAARSTADLERVVQEITGHRGQALAVPTDVTRLADVERMSQVTADRFGGIDLVVVHAGGNLENSRIEHSDPMHWAATIEVNLTAAYSCARHAMPSLKRRGGGKILTIGSGLAIRGDQVCRPMPAPKQV
jgi:3-oxoacyl-[acyl-carrier protein] reductase